MPSKTAKVQYTSAKKSPAKKSVVVQKSKADIIQEKKFTLKDLDTSSSNTINKNATLKDFGMVPSKIAKKNEKNKLTELKTYVNTTIDAYLENDLDKKAKERLGKILNALSSYKDRLEKMHPVKTEDDTESESG